MNEHRCQKIRGELPGSGAGRRVGRAVLRAAWRVAFAMLAVLGTRAFAADTIDCPTINDGELTGKFNYLDPTYQKEIRGIEGNHMNADVVALRHGQSGVDVGGDLVFTLGYIPNHHPAMALLSRLAFRDNNPKPAGLRDLTAECWLNRAVVFAPNDARARLILGVHLARFNKPRAAMGQLEEADRLDPDNPEVNYNLGLVSLSLQDYDKALAYAKKAYALGFPLEGLRKKLVAAGKWKD